MKNLLLLASLSGVLLLGACGNEENKAESQEKKSESVEKKDKQIEKEYNTDTQTEQVTEEPVSQEQQQPGTDYQSVNQQPQEPERYGKEQLTEAEQNEIANKQAEEYGKAHPEGEPSNEGKIGPGPEDPDYKPDPRFTEGVEGYDPVEGAKDPNKDDFTFK